MVVDFARRVAGKSDDAEILGFLAEVAVTHIGAEAAAVVRVLESGEVRVAASRNLPDLTELRLEPDTMGAELERTMLRAAYGRFERAHTLPLVADGALFGALVLLTGQGAGMAAARLELAHGVADLAAIALRNAYDRARLLRTLAELRASREILARTEKLRLLGQMAAGVAHDLRNILNPLSLQATLLKIRANDPAQVESLVDSVERTVRRGCDTVERLRAFSRGPHEIKREVVDLGVLVEEAVALCRPRVPSGTALLAESAAPPPVSLEPSELVNAVANLVMNAIEAMPTGGAVTVRTGRSDGGGWVMVQDNGPGMPPEVRERIFEPFFTTKGAAGTGLGLAIVGSFVERQGGRITVESAPGEGTRFTLWFPEVDAATPAA